MIYPPNITVTNRGQGSWLCKTVVHEDAFIDRFLSTHHYGVKWNEEYLFHTRLVCGSRSSPTFFDWIAQHNYGINFMLHLLDDFLTIYSPNATAERTMARFTLVFKMLCVTIAPHKTETYCTVAIFRDIHRH